MLSLIDSMSTGIKFYPLDFAGTGMPSSFSYCRGRVFALPAPYPTHFHAHCGSPMTKQLIAGFLEWFSAKTGQSDLIQAFQ